MLILYYVILNFIYNIDYLKQNMYICTHACKMLLIRYNLFSLILYNTFLLFYVKLFLQIILNFIHIFIFFSLYYFDFSNILYKLVYDSKSYKNFFSLPETNICLFGKNACHHLLLEFTD